MNRAFVKLALLTIFEFLCPPRLLHVVLAELHEAIKFTVGLQHADVLDDTLLALLCLAALSARWALLGD